MTQAVSMSVVMNTGDIFEVESLEGSPFDRCRDVLGRLLVSPLHVAMVFEYVDRELSTWRFNGCLFDLNRVRNMEVRFRG